MIADAAADSLDWSGIASISFLRGQLIYCVLSVAELVDKLYE